MKRLRHIFAAAVAGLSMSACATLPIDAPQRAVAREMRAADPVFRDEAMERAKLLVVPYEEGSTPWHKVTTARQLMGKSHSGFDAALFRNGDKFAFAFYGYNGIEDLNEVVKIGFGGIPRHQLREARAFVESAGTAYGFDPSDAEFVGHSMGGYIAKAVGPHTGAADIWAYNSPGFKLRDPHHIDKLFHDKGVSPPPPVYNVDARNDIVGQWGYQTGQVYELDAGKRHHAIASLVGALRRMDPFAQDDPPLAAEKKAEHKKPGFLGRAFNKVTQSHFVQKHIVSRFRRPAPPPDAPAAM